MLKLGKCLVLLAAILPAESLTTASSKDRGSQEPAVASSQRQNLLEPSESSDGQSGKAVPYSHLPAKLASEGKHIEAEKVGAKAVKILRVRRGSALRGGFDPETALTRARAYLNHGERVGSLLDRYLRVAGTLAQDGGESDALRSRAFMAAQDHLGSAPARSMAMAAARRTAGSAELARLDARPADLDGTGSRA